MGRFRLNGSKGTKGDDDKSLASTLAASLGARVHVDITIPRTDVRGKMRLCSRREELEAKAEARTRMVENGYPVSIDANVSLDASEQWPLEVAVSMLAIAVRDPADTELALAPIEEWRELDDMQILAMWSQYDDLSKRLDPIGTVSLTATQIALIDEAAKKKDIDRLMVFGSHALASYAITLASRPATSETPTSTSGP